MEADLTAETLALARAEGVAGVGVTTADPFPDTRADLVDARESGRSGRLGFTYRDPVTATDTRASFPWAWRIVAVSWDYSAVSPPPPPPSPPTGAAVARFATADHYRALRTALEGGGHSPG